MCTVLIGFTWFLSNYLGGFSVYVCVDGIGRQADLHA